MANRRTRKSNRRKRKNTGQTAHASLAGFAPLIESKGIFDKIHQQSLPSRSGVLISQKQLVYRPTDKLIFVVLGLLVGCEHIDEINHRLRPDKVLLSGFGYDSCADQSVIQDTLDGCVGANVIQLKRVYQINNRWIKNKSAPNGFIIWALFSVWRFYGVLMSPFADFYHSPYP